MSDLVKAVLLGIIEGVTEFIPVSSTGHLILAGELLSFEGPKASTFEIFIQFGAILAVVALYWREWIGLIPRKAEIAKSGFSGSRGFLLLIAGSVPALLAGALLHKKVKSMFLPNYVAVALIVGGILLILADRKQRQAGTTLEEITFKQTIMIGLFQCLSLWPGFSRAGATMIGGLVCGLDRITTARFSFFLAVPIITAASFYDLLKNREALSLGDLPLFALGFVVSFFVAMASIRFFLKLLERYSLAAFGVYRIILGALVLLLM